MIGCDLVHIPSFQAQLEIPGTTILQWFSPTERAQSHLDKGIVIAAQHLAARWAAKEAFIKAWSVQNYGNPPALTETNLRWADIEVVCDSVGRPQLRLHGQVRQLSGIDRAAISLSHEGDYALAVCTLDSAR